MSKWITVVGVVTGILLGTAGLARASHQTYVGYSGDGCCWIKNSWCMARPDAADERCQGGFMLEVGKECGNAPCNSDPTFNPSHPLGVCLPEVDAGSEPEVADGLDNDCDGLIDDEQCDNIDNDGDGETDEDAGSCLLRMLIVPLCWDGDQASFEQAARTQTACPGQSRTSPS